MVSPELLRRYPFFAGVADADLKNIAMIADMVALGPGTILFEADQPADALYFLVDGSVELHFVVIDRENPKIRKDFFVTEIDPGEVFGLSALIEPHRYSLTLRVGTPSHVISIRAEPLRALCDANSALGYRLMKRLAKAALLRLGETRVHLVAARA